MADVLIYADSLRSPEMRHEVPLVVPDPFLYAERDSSQHVVASSFELDRIKAVAPHLELLPYEEFGLDDLYAQGLSRDEIELEVILRAARRFGIEKAVVPATFPLEVALASVIPARLRLSTSPGPIPPGAGPSPIREPK